MCKHLPKGNWGHALVLALGGFLVNAAPVFAEQVPVLQPPPPTTVPISSSAKTHGSVWIGADVEPGSAAGSIGATFALNGNINTDGALLRASAGYGGYESGPVNNPRVQFEAGSLLLGYQAHLGSVYVSGFVGPQVVHNGKGAEPFVRGTSWSALFNGEIVVPAGDMEVSTWGSYSTFENQYYVQGRVLYKASPTFKIGPQVALMGGNTWKSGRAGGYLGVGTPFGMLEGGLGYTWDRDGSRHQGVYGNASVTVRF